MSLRFSTERRLRSRREFTVVQQHGRRVATRYLTLLARPNTTGHDRLGIIASRRLGGAVVRNRAKRRVREVFRQQAPATAGGVTYDLVVIPKRDMLTAPFAALQGDFERGVRRVRMGGPR